MHFRTVLPLILLLSCTCRSPAQREAAPPEPGRAELWVDASTEGPGEGSRARPLRSLGEALGLPGPLTVRLAPGRYQGPFVLPPGTRLEGGGPGVVLEGATPEGTVLQVGGDATVSDVVVEGGGAGLDVANGGRVRLTRVAFQGQRLGAVKVSAGFLDVEGGRFEAGPTASVGVLIERGQSSEESEPGVSGGAPAGATASTGAEPADLDASGVDGARVDPTTQGRTGSEAPRAAREGRGSGAPEPSREAPATQGRVGPEVPLAAREGQGRGAPASSQEAPATQGRASSKPPLATHEGQGRGDPEPSRADHATRGPSGAEEPANGDHHRVPLAQASIRTSTFTGPYRRAVRVRGADSQVVVEDTRFSGPATAVSVDEARAEVRRSTAEGGQSAAFSVMNGMLVLDDVKVTGHEYAVSAMRARRLEVRRFTSVRALRAGMGLSMSQAQLRDIVVRDSGEYGGLQFMGGDLDVERIRIEGASEYGLMAIRGKLRLRDATIERVRTSDGIAGDGLHLRQLEADVEDVVVRDAQGACVLVAQDARVSLRDANLRGCGAVGLLVDTLSRLRASEVEIRGAATALGALGDGELHVDGLTARDLAEGLVHAECGGATQVRLRNVRTEDTRGLSAACVHREAPPK